MPPLSARAAFEADRGASKDSRHSRRPPTSLPVRAKLSIAARVGSDVRHDGYEVLYRMSQSVTHERSAQPASSVSSASAFDSNKLSKPGDDVGDQWQSM